MVYIIPRGTPIVIQQGGKCYDKTTQRDLWFQKASVDRPSELVFECHGIRIAAAKALVIGGPEEDSTDDAAISRLADIPQNV
jgi:hypothetical protein